MIHDDMYLIGGRENEVEGDKMHSLSRFGKYFHYLNTSAMLLLKNTNLSNDLTGYGDEAAFCSFTYRL